MFGKSKTAGRVDLVRNGNTVTAATKGVAVFTLLLSPDRFDFSQPIKVVANGRQVFHARVKPSVANTLTPPAAMRGETTGGPERRSRAWLPAAASA
jgi:hypothetical protein